MTNQFLCNVTDNLSILSNCKNVSVVEHNSTTAEIPSVEHIIWVPYAGLVFVVIICIVLIVSYYNHSIRMKKRRQNTMDYLERDIDLNRKRLYAMMHARITPEDCMKETGEQHQDGVPEAVRIQPLFFTKHTLNTTCSECGTSPKRIHHNFPVRAPLPLYNDESIINIQGATDSRVGHRCCCHHNKAMASSEPTVHRGHLENVGSSPAGMHMENESKESRKTSQRKSRRLIKQNTTLNSFDEPSTSSSSLPKQKHLKKHQASSNEVDNDSDLRHEDSTIHEMDNIDSKPPKVKHKNRRDSTKQMENNESSQEVANSQHTDTYEDLIGKAIRDSNVLPSTFKHPIRKETIDSGLDSEDLTPTRVTLVSVGQEYYEKWLSGPGVKESIDTTDKDSQNSNQSTLSDAGDKFHEKWPREAKATKSLANFDHIAKENRLKQRNDSDSSNNNNNRNGRTDLNKAITYSRRKNASPADRPPNSDNSGNSSRRLNSVEESTSFNGHVNKGFCEDSPESKSGKLISQRVLSDHFYGHEFPLNGAKTLMSYQSTTSSEGLSYSDIKFNNMDQQPDNEATYEANEIQNNCDHLSRSLPQPAVSATPVVNHSTSIMNESAIKNDMHHQPIPPKLQKRDQRVHPQQGNEQSASNQKICDATFESAKKQRKKKSKHSLTKSSQRSRRLGDSSRPPTPSSTQIFIVSSHLSSDKINDSVRYV